MNSQKVLYSPGNNDECLTPDYGVKPLLKYLERFRDKIIWCPFSTDESQFVKIFRENGFKVTNSHIDNGDDFYTYEPEKWDLIVDNPPFTNKKFIFKRAIELGKPFALLMANTWLNDAAPKQLFKDVDLQLLMFDRRIEYNGNKKITFSSSYFCRDFLNKQIICEELIK